MGVPRDRLPKWDDLQFVVGQLHKLPLLDEVPVGTGLVIGPNAAKPLSLDIPLFVSDMSFGALSEEAKVALSKGADLAGTGICSGEGGMLPEEQAANARYFYELASARFGFSWDKVKKTQAFHFKGGQGAKTGTGGHLPGDKVRGKIAEVRELPEGQPAISPATIPGLDVINSVSGLRGRGARKNRRHPGRVQTVGTAHRKRHRRGLGSRRRLHHSRRSWRVERGAAPLIFRDNISVPTIPALARARRHLDASDKSDVTLIITGGLRRPCRFRQSDGAGGRRNCSIQCRHSGDRLYRYARLPYQ